MTIIRAFLGVEHLIKNGYKKIGHIAGPENLQISRDRYNGYRDALAKYKFGRNEDWVVRHDLSLQSASKCSQILLSKRKRPDAVFAVNDPAAIQLIVEAKRMGIIVGPELGVVGFSNDSRSEVIEPSLTTLQQPIEEIASTSVDLLLKKIEFPNQSLQFTTLLKTFLVIRDSSCKIPRIYNQPRLLLHK